MTDIVVHVATEARSVVDEFCRDFPGRCEVGERERHGGGTELALLIEQSPAIISALTAMIGVLKGMGVRYRVKKGEHLLEIAPRDAAASDT